MVDVSNKDFRKFSKEEIQNMSEDEYKKRMADYIVNHQEDFKMLYDAIREFHSLFIEITDAVRKHKISHYKNLHNHDCCLAEINDIILSYSPKVNDFNFFKNGDLG